MWGDPHNDFHSCIRKWRAILAMQLRPDTQFAGGPLVRAPFSFCLEISRARKTPGVGWFACSIRDRYRSKATAFVCCELR
ncbi:hypothetical protein MPLB_1990010 [Mesorhizobium sp. ORS 3324]|nr:hypothetical protein MPLB_1990010 [Mesorhizobium sp. ORS 3324]